MTVTAWLLIGLFVITAALVIWAGMDEPAPPRKPRASPPAPRPEPLDDWPGVLCECRWHHLDKALR